jgi:hypothetical protein
MVKHCKKVNTTKSYVVVTNLHAVHFLFMLRVMDTIVTHGYCLLYKADASTSGLCNYEEREDTRYYH